MDCPKNNPATTPYEALAEMFGLRSDLDLSKDEKAVLKAAVELGDTTRYALCAELDLRPAKLEKALATLAKKGLVEIADETSLVTATGTGVVTALKTKAARRSEDKFRKFLKALDDEELLEFCRLCSELKGGEAFAELYATLVSPACTCACADADADAEEAADEPECDEPELADEEPAEPAADEPEAEAAEPEAAADEPAEPEPAAEI